MSYSAVDRQNRIDTHSVLLGLGRPLSLVQPSAPSTMPRCDPFVNRYFGYGYETRIFKSCSDPHAPNRFVSEVYPFPASWVRDSRPPLLQVGSQARMDGRPPFYVLR